MGIEVWDDDEPEAEVLKVLVRHAPFVYAGITSYTREKPCEVCGERVTKMITVAQRRDGVDKEIQICLQPRCRRGLFSKHDETQCLDEVMRGVGFREKGVDEIKEEVRTGEELASHLKLTELVNKAKKYIEIYGCKLEILPDILGWFHKKGRLSEKQFNVVERFVKEMELKHGRLAK